MAVGMSYIINNLDDYSNEEIKDYVIDLVCNFVFTIDLINVDQ